MSTTRLLGATALSLLFITSPVHASETEALRTQIKLLEERLSQLEKRQAAPSRAPVAAAPADGSVSQRLAIVERKQELAEEDAKAKSEKNAVVEVGKKGLSITSADKAFGIKLRGYAQIDARSFQNDKNNTGRDEVFARRLRPIIEATAYKDFSLRLMPDFAGSSTRIFDAHIDYKYSDPLQLRVGKFKPPVGLERLQSATDIFFAERGQPTNLAPSRDYGVMLYGDVIPQTLEYQIGVFNGNADLANTDNDDDDKKDIVARVFAHPFRNSDTLALQGLGIGVAGSIGQRDGAATRTILGDYRTPGQQAFFRYRTGAAATDNTYADGTHRRFYPQAYYYYNNFGILGEYAISSQEVTRANNHGRLDHTAWQVAGSYVLTGEDVNFRGGVKPKADFNPANGGWGAFEVVARAGETDIDNDAFPQFATITSSASNASTLGAGLNWYFNESAKLVLDYERTQFEGGATTGDRPDEHVLISRVQYRF